MIGLVSRKKTPPPPPRNASQVQSTGVNVSHRPDTDQDRGVVIPSLIELAY
jgi:hypothetical protein